MDAVSQRPQRNRKLTEKGAAQVNEKEEKLRKQEENQRRKKEKASKLPKCAAENSELLVSYFTTSCSSTDLSL